MNNRDIIERIAERINHEQLAAVLAGLGWEVYGGRAGLYSRWRLGESDATIILPVNSAMSDYRELLREAVGQLTVSRDPAAARLLTKLSARDMARDEVRFRKEVTVAAGAISWPQGEELVASARLALIAGAKTRKSRRAYFGNRNSRFAQAYLSAVLMGQTEVGSYVVTALTPTEQVFPEKEASAKQTALPSVGSYTGREITQAMVSALRVTREAVDHYTQTSSFSAFESGVKDGISYELTNAVLGLVNGSERADITVEWDILGIPAEEASLVKLEFERRDQPALSRAVERLAAYSTPELVRVSGMVTLLERPRPASDGIIRLDVISGSTASKLRVHLSEQDYEIALDAHRNGLALTLTGHQEREGQFYWLYEAVDLEVVPAPDVPPPPGEIPGQDELPLF